LFYTIYTSYTICLCLIYKCSSVISLTLVHVIFLGHGQGDSWQYLSLKNSHSQKFSITHCMGPVTTLRSNSGYNTQVKTWGWGESCSDLAWDNLIILQVQVDKENSMEFPLDFLHYLYNYYMVCILFSHTHHVILCDYDCVTLVM